MSSRIQIIALAMGASAAYGILHDQVTAHLCVEYFTVGHLPLFPTESPVLLALAWGVAATWWVGLGFGVPLAFAAAQRVPPLTARDLVRPLGVVLVGTAALALLSGLTGYLLARHGALRLEPWLASRIEPSRRVFFIADWWAHGASYLGAAIGAGFLIHAVRTGRIKPRRGAGV